MTGPRACFVLVPATYASLVLDKRSGSDGQGVPAPLGNYLESRDNLEDALIEQGRIKGDSKATMGYSRRLYLDLFIPLINRVKRNTGKALLPWMKFYPRVNVTDYAFPLEEDKMSLQVP